MRARHAVSPSAPFSCSGFGQASPGLMPFRRDEGSGPVGPRGCLHEPEVTTIVWVQQAREYADRERTFGLAHEDRADHEPSDVVSRP